MHCVHPSSGNDEPVFALLAMQATPLGVGPFNETPLGVGPCPSDGTPNSCEACEACEACPCEACEACPSKAKAFRSTVWRFAQRAVHCKGMQESRALVRQFAGTPDRRNASLLSLL